MFQFTFAVELGGKLKDLLNISGLMKQILQAINSLVFHSADRLKFISKYGAEKG